MSKEHVRVAVVGLLAVVGVVIFGSTRDAPIEASQPFAPQPAEVTIRPTATPGIEVRAPIVYGDCPVTRVVDGDTFHALCADVDITVRVIGIDTPETVAPGKPVQCYGPEATARARELLDGRMVHLVLDPTQDTVDRYGRRLAYVQIKGRDFGHVMISEGYAREYTYDVPAINSGTYQRSERLAQARKAGLWGACPTPAAATTRAAAKPASWSEGWEFRRTTICVESNVPYAPLSTIQKAYARAGLKVVVGGSLGRCKARGYAVAQTVPIMAYRSADRRAPIYRDACAATQAWNYGKLTKVTIKINVTGRARTACGGGKEWFDVFNHEFGHAVGLSHSQSRSSSIMRDGHFLSASDIAEIRSIYKGNPR